MVYGTVPLPTVRVANVATPLTSTISTDILPVAVTVALDVVNPSYVLDAPEACTVSEIGETIRFPEGNTLSILTKLEVGAIKVCEPTVMLPLELFGCSNTTD